jgi:DNA primase
MKLHQHGCRKVVALMGSTMSAAQEELIARHTDRSQVIVMLDEDEAGTGGARGHRRSSGEGHNQGGG